MVTNETQEIQSKCRTHPCKTDTLSHRHLSKKDSSKPEDVNSIVETRPTSNRKHQEIQKAILADRVLQEITHLTLNG